LLRHFVSCNIAVTVKTPIQVKYEEILKHVMPGVVADLVINILLMYDKFFSIVAYCYVFTQGSMYFFSSINIMSLNVCMLKW
jgi:hypothetical protein